MKVEVKLSKYTGFLDAAETLFNYKQKFDEEEISIDTIIELRKVELLEEIKDYLKILAEDKY